MPAPNGVAKSSPVPDRDRDTCRQTREFCAGSRQGARSIEWLRDPRHARALDPERFEQIVGIVSAAWVIHHRRRRERVVEHVLAA